MEEEAADQYQFDLTVEFEKGSGERKKFTDLLDNFGYSN